VRVTFLTLVEVLALHADQIHRYGGRPGIRDLSLLDSALATPAATFGARLLHTTISEMAGAYLFHIVRNHPFVDGNKRTGLMAMLTFIGLNRHRLGADPEDLLELVVGVADGRLTKAEASVFVQRHFRGRPGGEGDAPPRVRRSR
jgi:death-on-curing protein